MSFLKVGDRAAGAIKSGGTTRRAAKMVCLDLDHPEVEDFIDWKVREEEKVSALIAGSKAHRKLLRELELAVRLEDGSLETSPKNNPAVKKVLKKMQSAGIPQGLTHKVLSQLARGMEVSFPEFTTGWEEEAYGSVSGQNSNNSIRIPGAFFEALKKEGHWNLLNRVDRAIYKSVPAAELWEKIAYAAWASADPGLQFDTTINDWHTCPKGGDIRASNPCSEYMFLDDTACNLASLNLLKFYDEATGTFRIEDYTHAIRIWTVVLEISVLMAQFPSPVIAQKSFEYRTLGLGYANLGALLMSMGHSYGSPEALAVTGALTAILGGESYATSAEMARQLGTFQKFSENRDNMLRVIRNHRRAAMGVVSSDEFEGLSVSPVTFNPDLCPAPLAVAARLAWDRALEMGEQYGFRNAQTTVIAPTGTIGLVMDCDTTGIEPDYALVKFKKLSGGGYFRIINQSVPRALKRLGYSLSEIQDMVAYCVGHGAILNSPFINVESLREKGFTDLHLEKIHSSLKQAFDLRFVFHVGAFGEAFCKDVLGLEDSSRPGFSLLNALGFSGEEIELANQYVFGKHTLEGAPHLKKAHYAVFDCASRCGKHGERSLHYLTHIEMMAAAQPFISGAISKTINMPMEATLEEVKEAYELSWRKMCKAISIYRDGSKLSQPLSNSLVDEEEIDAEEIIEKNIPLIAQKMAQQTLRRELPGKRFGYTVKATVGGQKVYLRTGEYEDGSLGEIFVDVFKEGAAYRSLMNAFAISVSIGLQYGVPLEEFVNRFHLFRCEPNGHVSDHDNIKFCSSLIDFLFRDLAMNYLGRTDLVHVPPKQGLSAELGAPALSLGAMAAVPPSRSVDAALTREEYADSETVLHSKLARTQGYEGDPCSECGHFTLVRSGTCMRCVSCGSTSGCS